MDPSQTVHLPGFLHTLEPTLNQYGYLAVAGFVLLEDFGVPVPGETILILGAVYAGTGRLSIWLVGLLGFLAAIAGDNIGFAIGHFGGRALVERFGRYVFLTKERLDKTTDFFERRGGWIIILARFIEGLRQANGIIAGISGMHWATFLAFNTIGAALWVAVWTSVGYFAGDNITSIYNAISHYTLYVVIAIVVLILAWIGRRVWRKRKERAAAPARAHSPNDDSEAPARAEAPSEQPQAQSSAPDKERQAQSSPPGKEPQAQSSPPGKGPQAQRGSEDKSS
ncbi:MAG TPA: VTT domain-containing protein [Solirubrobacteraceae bacterium]|jgi:membrane protein DedA with SNARE-associated domain